MAMTMKKYRTEVQWCVYSPAMEPLAYFFYKKKADALALAARLDADAASKERDPRWTKHLVQPIKVRVEIE